MKKKSREYRHGFTAGYNRGFDAGYKQGCNDGNPIVQIAEIATDTIRSFAERLNDPEFLELLSKLNGDDKTDSGILEDE